jgi:hypothetical protein
LHDISAEQQCTVPLMGATKNSENGALILTSNPSPASYCELTEQKILCKRKI